MAPRTVVLLIASLAAAPSAHVQDIESDELSVLQTHIQTRATSNDLTCGNECSMEFVSGTIAPLTLVTIAFNLPPHLEAGLLRNRREEAQAFGYENCFYTQPECLPRQSRGPKWAKVAATRQLLSKGRQAVAVIDGDAWMVERRSFESVCGSYLSAGKSVIFTKDCTNRGLWGGIVHEGGLNTGVWVTTNDTWAQRFWNDIWEDKSPHAWAEQEAVFEYWEAHENDFLLHTTRLETHDMNSCNESYQPGDFIFHAYDMYNRNFTDSVSYLIQRFG
mmetsp:Transcript_70633/g.163286  ORF Transcript_70633/g.163286 Transcript_70633/m.163286 type:complete len:275 (-) Transcript_70633:84-908(-)|eukprot:CAMPEP_0171094308 /NCGR_PEP_ID=MMETSP0766_2-20121228/40677_1 /TAXON_ID=439317 /ORGANISM="Gambierdiscus australes, Strain CAWD 149" /LENGTH=274 /DNA_ID=CAMNT_0011552919 /DNA_START=59 /DNA_END=883 /DNA_ORIENTATION=+